MCSRDIYIYTRPYIAVISFSYCEKKDRKEEKKKQEKKLNCIEIEIFINIIEQIGLQRECV